jgi:phytoene dehydrogenase-like protein
LRLAAAIGPSGLVEFGRFAVLPVRRMADEHFRGVGGGVLLAGAALHADVAPEAAGSGVYGMLMCGLGQQVGFPVPEGGSQRLTDALVSRLESRGGQVVCNARVSAIDVRDGRAVGVRTVDGRDVPATRAVLADVGAPQLYTKLLDHSHLPAGLLDDLDRFEYGTGTVKVDWALSGKIPWRDPEVARAGTVHLADSMDHLSEVAMQLATGHVPRAPFLLIGQMTTTDPSRSPAGTESAWAYTHVPPRVRGDAGGDITGVWDERETGAFAQRIEARIEAFAPGFRELIIARHVFTPPTFEEADANLVAGDVNGGTAQLHQQLVFRPTPGLGRPETPIARLYLASASAHPGGGVHGAPGANAARAALAHEAAGRRLLAVGAAAASLAAVQIGRAALRRRH